MKTYTSFANDLTICNPEVRSLTVGISQFPNRRRQ
jgi:hypothetical protein